MSLPYDDTCAVSFVDARHRMRLDEKVFSSQENKQRSDERMKTVHAALILCLNIGTDPPDVVKPNPCARMECWIDPFAISSREKSRDMIARTLQKLYERWQPKARFRICVDPTLEDVQKTCVSLRRNSKEDRVLFHYNGHGVPKPTKDGEIWVFNRDITQYIPLSVYDLQMWMGSPSVYVWDCNFAGLIIEGFFKCWDDGNSMDNDFNLSYSGGSMCFNKAENDSQLITGGLSGFIRGTPHLSNDKLTSLINQPSEQSSIIQNSQSGPDSTKSTQQINLCVKNSIHLAACRSDEHLPTNPDLPADLFTCCLTTPVKSAVMWYLQKHEMASKLPLDVVDRLAGQPTDRRTLLGELHSIFTATTDTIAWHVLPRNLFYKLFRQDIFVACLFRNFLLADRIMRSYGCTPASYPVLPPTHDHPMWQSWDYALDVCMNNLINNPSGNSDLTLAMQMPSHLFSSASLPVDFSNISSLDSARCPFVGDQLKALDVWLRCGSNCRKPPLQLPTLLQTLLRQTHRMRAVELLERFLDLGPWAIDIALSVGIFTYMLRLLQCLSPELRPRLTFMWAKILALDSNCRHFLIAEGGHRYFLQILNDSSVVEQQKTVAAFVLARTMDENYTPGQEACMLGGFVTTCVDLLTDCQQPLFKRWLCLGLGHQWHLYDSARWQGIRCNACDKLYEALDDPRPETRAAAVFALGALLSNYAEGNEHATSYCHSVALVLVQKMCSDGSSMVRRELLVALHWLVLNFFNQIVTVAYETTEKKLDALTRAQARLSSGAATRLPLVTPKQKPSFVFPATTGISISSPFRKRNSLDANSIFQNGAFSPETKTHTVVSSCGSSGSSTKSRSTPKTGQFDSIAENLSAQALVVENGESETVRRVVSTKSLNKESDRRSSTVSTFTKFLGFGPRSPNDVVERPKSTSVGFRRESLPSSTLDSRLSSLSISSVGVMSSVGSGMSSGNVYVTVWRVFLNFAYDPSPDVAQASKIVVEKVNEGVALLHKVKLNSENCFDIVQGTNTTGLGSASNSTQPRLADIKASSTSDDQKPIFVVGSPLDSVVISDKAIGTSANPLLLTSNNRLRKSMKSRLLAKQQPTGICLTDKVTLPQTPVTRKPEMATSLVPANTLPTISFYSTIFTSPRRPVFGRKPPMLITTGNMRMGDQHLASQAVSSTIIPGDLSTCSSNFQNAMPRLLDSEFASWCCRRFMEPVLHLFSSEPMTEEFKDLDSLYSLADPNSVTSFLGNQKLLNVNYDNTERLPLSEWAHNSRRVIQEQYEIDSGFLESKKLESQLFISQSNRPQICARFFHYHPLLVVSEGGGILNFWHMNSKRSVASVDNDTNQCKLDATFLEIINPYQDQPLLMTGTDDGEIRIWDCGSITRLDVHADQDDILQTKSSASRHGSGQRLKLVASWNTVPFWLKAKLPLKLLYCWEQESGQLVVGGDSSTITIWDAHQERRTHELVLPAFGRGGQVTSLACDLLGHQLLAVGCSDGCVRLFDRRLTVQVNKTPYVLGGDCRAPISCLMIQRQAVGNRLVACALDGKTTVWDPRMFRDPLKSFKMFETSVLTFDDDAFADAFSSSEISSCIHPSMDLLVAYHPSILDSNQQLHKASLRFSDFSGRSYDASNLLLLQNFQETSPSSGQRSPSSSIRRCFQFHPSRALMACGSQDGLLSVHGLTND